MTRNAVFSSLTDSASSTLQSALLALLTSVALTLLLAMATPVYAEKLYISDDLSVELRSGPTLKHRITRFLKSGNQVTILESHTDNEGVTWSHVQNSLGTGWVRNQFLQSEPSAKVKVLRLNKQLEAIKKENKASSVQAGNLNAKVADLQTRHQAATERLQSIKRQYDELKATTSQSQALAEDNTKMRQQLELMASKLEQFETQNYQLQSDNRAEGIMQGAIAVIIGVILTLLLPHLARRRPKSTWD